ncbi:MAG: hypothetical protein WCK15_06810 [Pirellula sp.]
MSKTETQAIVNAEIDLVETVKKANSGEKQSLAILRRELADENANALIDIAGNRANSLEQSTLNVMLGDQQLGTRIVLLKKLDQMRAERRHLRAVKMLATVRKMALPLRIDLKAELIVPGPRSRFDLVGSTN